MRLNQVTGACTDDRASVGFYAKLGLRQIVDAPPRYARFETPTCETFSIHLVERATDCSTIVYFEVDALDELVSSLKGVGLAFSQEPTDQIWGWREARLYDPADNQICLFHAGSYRRFPPWRIGAETKD